MAAIRCVVVTQAHCKTHDSQITKRRYGLPNGRVREGFPWNAWLL